MHESFMQSQCNLQLLPAHANRCKVLSEGEVGTVAKDLYTLPRNGCPQCVGFIEGCRRSIRQELHIR
jgi:hypothetical protein